MEFNWNDLWFLVVIPIVQQLIKWISDKRGYTFPKWLNQTICLVLAAGLGLLTGSFAGLTLPIWSGDVIDFISQLVVLVVAAWASVSLLYEVLWDRLFTALKVATADKYKPF